MGGTDRYAEHLTLITTYGLKPGRWASVFQNIVTAENLFGK